MRLAEDGQRWCAWGRPSPHVIPPGVRAHALYCSVRCRQAAHDHPSARPGGKASGHARLETSARPGDDASPAPAHEASDRTSRNPSVQAIAEPSWSTSADASASTRREPSAEAPWEASAAPRRKPSALYVDHLGPYPGLLGWPRVWTRERDARAWWGPGPGVFHPPCNAWCVAYGLSSGRDRDCAPRAVEQVRAFGGVLEHPAHSLLWAAVDLPRPGDPPDAWGGFSIELDQARFGHAATKPTWLYVVRAWLPPMPPAVPLLGRPGVFELGIAHRTPEPFARWLLDLASSGVDGSSSGRADVSNLAWPDGSAAGVVDG